MTEREVIPVEAGLWESEGGEAYLVGSSCPSCGELYFPAKSVSFCSHCQHDTLDKVRLGRRGRITNTTVVYQKPGGDFYRGPVPYAFGIVELPEGVRVQTLFTGCEPEAVQVGMSAGLVIEKLCDDQENREIVCYKFKPETS